MNIFTLTEMCVRKDTSILHTSAPKGQSDWREAILSLSDWRWIIFWFCARFKSILLALKKWLAPIGKRLKLFCVN